MDLLNQKRYLDLILFLCRPKIEILSDAETDIVAVVRMRMSCVWAKRAVPQMFSVEVGYSS